MTTYKPSYILNLSPIENKTYATDISELLQLFADRIKNLTNSTGFISDMGNSSRTSRTYTKKKKMRIGSTTTTKNKNKIRKSKKRTTTSSKLKSRSSSRSKNRVTKKLCKKKVSEKIRSNINEFKAGRWKNKEQAIAVSFSEINKLYPRCKRYNKRR